MSETMKTGVDMDISETSEQTLTPRFTDNTSHAPGRETSGWIGFDLDGTLAHYDRDEFNAHGGHWIGDPMDNIVALVRGYKSMGYEVRIVTARVSGLDGDADKRTQAGLIRAWCDEHKIPCDGITATKDYRMLMLYDDRCAEVFTNSGLMWSDYLNYMLDAMNGMSDKDIRDGLRYAKLCIGQPGVRAFAELFKRLMRVIAAIEKSGAKKFGADIGAKDDAGGSDARAEDVGVDDASVIAEMIDISVGSEHHDGVTNEA